MVNYNTKTILTEMRMTVALSKMQNGELMTGFGQVIGGEEFKLYSLSGTSFFSKTSLRLRETFIVEPSINTR